MPKVKYVGSSNYREISAADFKSVGVEDQSGLVWDRDDRRDRRGAAVIHDVSEAAATYLIEKEPTGDFEIVKEEAPERASEGDKPPKAPK